MPKKGLLSTSKFQRSFDVRESMLKGLCIINGVKNGERSFEIIYRSRPSSKGRCAKMSIHFWGYGFGMHTYTHCDGYGYAMCDACIEEFLRDGDVREKLKVYYDIDICTNNIRLSSDTLSYFIECARMGGHVVIETRC